MTRGPVTVAGGEPRAPGPGTRWVAGQLPRPVMTAEFRSFKADAVGGGRGRWVAAGGQSGVWCERV